MRKPAFSHREPDGRSGVPDPWGAGGSGGSTGGGRPPSEPAIRAPWPALLLAGLLPAIYALQRVSGDPFAVADRLGFHPSLLKEGVWTGLLTAMFVHAGWMHALLNAVWALAFGAPVARRFGAGALSAAAFALFFVVCGVAGSLGFAAFHLDDASTLVGASGGVAGLMGAASRMIPPHDGRLAPLTSRPVLTMAGAWIAVNLLFAVIGLSLGGGGAPVAWQAHLFGYAAGLFLIAPALATARPRA